MSHYITKEEWQEATKRAKERPPLTEEEKAKLAALGEKMRSLSGREIWEMRRKAEERDGYAE